MRFFFKLEFKTVKRDLDWNLKENGVYGREGRILAQREFSVK
jgi:hypothetical protein